MTSLLRISLIAAVGMSASAWNVANTPPLGYNTWDYWHCSVNSTILMDTALAMNQSGLQAAGYLYVNSDDCWMLAQRDANGNQVANPEKFPDGFQAVTAYIHSLGLKSGLYTAKGPNTCAGFAASCDHEFQDAAQWASWGIDYVKDDSCSTCPNRTDDDDYHIMWQAIEASGHPMVLTVEGNPTYQNMSRGGLGNARRVGHDISPEWFSMLTLVDVAANLWPFAHNATNATYGGYFNDLDMIEVGNSPDFACGADSDALARCQVHFSYWCIMKAPIILGNNIPVMDAATFSVLANAEALSINQDALGIQGRRIAVQIPTNSSPAATPYDSLLVIKTCDATRPTQTWFWNASSKPGAVHLSLVTCNTSDPTQSWSFVPTSSGTTNMRNKAFPGMCVDSRSSSDPLLLAACQSSADSTQNWTIYSPGGQIGNGNQCLDVFNFQGPDVESYSCKAPSPPPGNQIFNYDSSTGQLSTSLNLPGQCVGLTSAVVGSLYTVDGAGVEWCVTSQGIGPCASGFSPIAASGGNATGPANYSLAISYDNSQYGSGPWPHSRYATSNGGTEVTYDAALLKSQTGSSIMIANQQSIINDDMIGNITIGGDFCLDATCGGVLEVWAGPLTQGRFAVGMFNRSPASDSITVDFSLLPGQSASSQFSVRDIWAATDRGQFTGSYTAQVGAHAVALLILTPV